MLQVVHEGAVGDGRGTHATTEDGDVAGGDRGSEEGCEIDMMESEGIKYNFKSQRGMVFPVVMKRPDGFDGMEDLEPKRSLDEIREERRATIFHIEGGEIKKKPKFSGKNLITKKSFKQSKTTINDHTFKYAIRNNNLEDDVRVVPEELLVREETENSSSYDMQVSLRNMAERHNNNDYT